MGYLCECMGEGDCGREDMYIGEWSINVFVLAIWRHTRI